MRKARRATELLGYYQQCGMELGRIRREAVDELVTTHGIPSNTVAAELGLTKGRITQIRQSSPPRERAFFGIGPVELVSPLRDSDRPAGTVALEDVTAAERLEALMRSLSLDVRQRRVRETEAWTPTGDTAAICGPKSSTGIRDLLAQDPYLRFEEHDGRWGIQNLATGDLLTSPIDDGDRTTDIAYIGRLAHERGEVLVIAGVHALGSVGAVDYLATELPHLYADVGSSPFSMVVQTTSANMETAYSEVIAPPSVHP